MNRSLKFEPLLPIEREPTSGWQQTTSEKTTMDREENIGNCPHCTRIIFKDAVFNSEASFSTRCPHCNKPVKVIIKHKVEIKLIAVVDERNSKKGPGSGILK